MNRQDAKLHSNTEQDPGDIFNLIFLNAFWRLGG
jgi:hypothetical protein